jgi:membrane fusion protein, multidrug efflux system
MQNSSPVAPNGKRKQGLIFATALFSALGILYGAYWALSVRHYVGTDNAYVAGNVVQVTPQIAGTVVAIQADDTYWVTAGTPLVLLDRADANVALEQSSAALAQTVRQVRSLFNTNASLAANVELAQSQLRKAQADLQRRGALADSGAISYEDLNHADSALTAAQADLLASKEKLATNQAFTDNVDIEHHPSVAQAAAKVREAYLALQRTSIPAPVSGFVAKRAVQIGQRVAPGNPLMAIIPLDQVWVDANFKEGQLAQMRIGQSVTLTSDLYGTGLVYHGKVAGLSAGTGAAFSLLPAQNATGNWIKVVQRVPVKVQLDAQELQAHPLRIGLSAIVEVDIQDQNGAPLAAAKGGAAVYQTTVYNHLDRDADALVQKIIAANRGDTSSVAKKNLSGSAAKPGTRHQLAARH